MSKRKGVGGGAEDSSDEAVEPPAVKKLRPELVSIVQSSPRLITANEKKSLLGPCASIFRIEVVSMEKVFRKPWRPCRQKLSSGSGFAIMFKRGDGEERFGILTNAVGSAL